MSKNSIEFDQVENLADFVIKLNETDIPDDKKWSYITQYQTYNARKKGIPFSGHFELTPFCNLDCKMCYVHLSPEKLQGSSVLSVEEWKRIFLEARNAGMMRATLTGGECLIYPGFEELYLYLESLGIRPTIKTNGVFLEGDKFRFLEKHPPLGIIVSLYGSSEEAYKKVTGIRAFNRVIGNIKQLNKIQSYISLSITPSKFMYTDAKELLELAESLNYNYTINYGLFVPRENTGRKNYDLSIDEYVAIHKIARSC